MRREVKNDKVLKAITIGLAAMIAVTSAPVTVLAEDDTTGGGTNGTTGEQAAPGTNEIPAPQEQAAPEPTTPVVQSTPETPTPVLQSAPETPAAPEIPAPDPIVAPVVTMEEAAAAAAAAIIPVDDLAAQMAAQLVTPEAVEGVVTAVQNASQPVQEHLNNVSNLEVQGEQNPQNLDQIENADQTILNQITAA